MGVPCFEVLVVTIMLWIALFGIFDELVMYFDDTRVRLISYSAVGLTAVAFVALTDGINFCSLQ